MLPVAELVLADGPPLGDELHPASNRLRALGDEAHPLLVADPLPAVDRVDKAPPLVARVLPPVAAVLEDELEQVVVEVPLEKDEVVWVLLVEVERPSKVPVVLLDPLSMPLSKNDHLRSQSTST